jgi:HSP20 family molecular chaperone IbpA
MTMNPLNLERTPAANGGRAEKTRARQLAPVVDVYENETELLIVADLPGVTREELDIQIDPPELRIETKANDRDGSSYRRTFTIDERIDANKVSADLKNGVLTVRLPKAEEVKPRKIAIRGAA